MSESRFVTPLEARRFPGTRKRQLLSPLSFYSSEYDETITAPPGFIFNGVSAPLVWGGDGEASSGIHDWMYANPKQYTREKADRVFREALKAEGMNIVRRNSWWLTLRLFGGFFYGKETHATNDPDSYGGA